MTLRDEVSAFKGFMDKLKQVDKKQERTDVRRELAQTARQAQRKTLAELPAPSEALVGFYYLVRDAVDMTGIPNGTWVVCADDGVGGYEWHRVGDDGDPSALPFLSKFAFNSTGIGFYGTSPIAKPNVAGSKGGNVALTNLITALANLGLISDTTT